MHGDDGKRKALSGPRATGAALLFRPRPREGTGASGRDGGPVQSADAQGHGPRRVPPRLLRDDVQAVLERAPADTWAQNSGARTRASAACRC